MTEPANSNNQMVVTHLRWLSPTAMNLQQLHRHEAQSQATTAHLMRRLDLPSHLASRYQSFGLQAQGFTPRFNGQRREVSGLGSEQMLQRSTSEFGETKVSDWANSTKGNELEVSSSDWRQPSIKGNELEASSSDRSYHILSDHHNKIADTPLSTTHTFTNNPSVTAAIKPTKTANSAPLTIQAKAESSDQTNLPSGLFRISRQPIPDTAAVPISDTTTQAIASTAAKPNANTTTLEFAASPTQPSSTTSNSHLPESPAAITPQASKIDANPIQASSRVIKPQIQAKNQIISTPIQQNSGSDWVKPDAKGDRSSELVLRSVANLDNSLSQTPIPEVANSQNQHQSASITEVQPPISSTPFPQTIAQKSTALPVVKVASTSIQLKPQIPIQSQLANQGTIRHYSQISEPISSSDTLQKMPIAETLPLHKLTTVIQRQTETTPPLETSATPINPTTPPVTNAVASEVDIAELAEQVSRIMMRQMVIEKERRGLGK